MKWKFRLTGFLSLAAALSVVAMGMQSCSEETYPDVLTPEEGDSQGGVKQYFSMRILSADNETITADHYDFTLQDGTEFEHMVDLSDRSSNVVIFINNDGTYAGYTSVDYDHMYAQGTDEGYPTEISFIGVIHSPDEEVIYGIPDQALLVLNAHDIKDKLDLLGKKEGATLKDVLMLTDDAHDDSRRPGRSDNYHTMTSTAYLQPDNGEWKHSILFKIDKSKIYENRMQAVLTPAAVAVVERMSSKFSLRMPGAVNGTVGDFIPNEGREQVIVCDYKEGHASYNYRAWTCTIEGWGINKYEKQSYYFRDIIGEGADTRTYPYTYGSDINTTGKPFYNGWNNSSKHRAYWGKDPHYATGYYPRQYRWAVDNPGLDNFFKNEVSLGYISYNQLSTNVGDVVSKDGAVLYSSENTFPDNRIGGLWEHDLGASELVLGARLHIDKVSETGSDYDLFRNRIGIFYPTVTDFATYFIETFNTQLTSQSTMSFRYYNWAEPDKNSGIAEMHTVELKHDNYKLYYGDQPLTPAMMASLSKYTMPAYIENGDGKVIPWIEGMYIGRREVDPDTYQEVGAIQKLSISANDFKSLIYDWVGSFDHFNKGRMVYSVPVLHKASADKVSNPSYRPSVGDYGVARNTWYSFAVEKIQTLGSPIDDPDQKIIIYQTSLENSILVEIKVLEWHVISTDVTLPDKL